ncbi:MAG: patatin-like phospholipase family protein [Pseudonocardia sp.]
MTPRLRRRHAPAVLPGDPEVVDALLRRRAEGSRPGARRDPHRIALVVGGGGMRGAYTGGMVAALQDAGLGEAFDVVYGSSAGAFVGASLLLGEGHGAARIFFEEMACKAFIDPRRLATGKPVVSLDHLFDHILSAPEPWERLGSGEVPLRVIATEAGLLRGHALDPVTPDEWKRALRATAAIPLLAGPAVELHGRRWIDGSVAEPIPVFRALSDGATHVLALLTRTVPELRREQGRPPWVPVLDLLAPGLGAMTQDVRRHAPVLAVLDDAAHPARGSTHLLAVTPERDLGVRGLTTDPTLVERATVAGYGSMSALLGRAEAA